MRQGTKNKRSKEEIHSPKFSPTLKKESKNAALDRLFKQKSHLNSRKRTTKLVLKEEKSKKTVAAMRLVMAEQMGVNLMQSTFIPDLNEMHEEQQIQQQRVAVMRDLEEEKMLDAQKQKKLPFHSNTSNIIPFNKLTPEEKLLTAKGVIRHNDRRKFWWDLWIIFLALYNCFFIPVEIAFEPPKLEQSILYLVVDILVDIFFILDIFINLRTTYITNKNEEIFDKKKIAIRYLLGQFTIDLLPVL